MRLISPRRDAATDRTNSPPSPIRHVAAQSHHPETVSDVKPTVRSPRLAIGIAKLTAVLVKWTMRNATATVRIANPLPRTAKSANYYVNCPSTMWCGEGDEMIFIDGDNNNMTLDLASVSYWYQDAASPLPRSFTQAERQPMPAITASVIHLWRDAWRKAHGNSPPLWGNERQP